MKKSPACCLVTQQDGRIPADTKQTWVRWKYGEKSHCQPGSCSWDNNPYETWVHRHWRASCDPKLRNHKLFCDQKHNLSGRFQASTAASEFNCQQHLMKLLFSRALRSANHDFLTFPAPWTFSYFFMLQPQKYMLLGPDAKGGIKKKRHSNFIGIRNLSFKIFLISEEHINILCSL